METSTANTSATTSGGRLSYLNYGSDSITRREIDDLKDFIEARLDGHNTASVERGLRIEYRITDLDRLYKERFDAADLRYQQRFDASGLALAAASQSMQINTASALAAAKEAVLAASVSAEKSVTQQNESNSAAILKSEVSFTKQIDGIITLLNTNAKTVDERFVAINARLDREDGKEKGGFNTRASLTIAISLITAIAGVYVGYLALGNHNPVYTQAPYASPPPTR